MNSRAGTERRRLGKGGPEVSAIGLGCMSLSGVYGKSDDTAGVALIHRAIERGVDHFDSSDMYGWGQNEELLGRALKGRREGIVIASKFGQTRRPGGANGVDGSPAYIAQACEASLKRLGVDVIDLYYQHRVDPAVPVEDTVGAMARLVEAGKVRFLGLCEARPERIRRAHATHPLAAVQSEFSLLYREEATETRELTRDLGIAFFAYAPLGRGFLTGDAKRAEDYPEGDYRRLDPRYQGENFDANQRAAAVVREIAAAKQAKPGQIALAWLLHKGDDVVPIPGTKRRLYLEENVAAETVRLDASDMEALDEALAPGKIAGPRYPDWMMETIDR